MNKLVQIIDGLPGVGHLNIAATDGRSSKDHLPVTGVVERAILRARMANATVLEKTGI